MDVLDCCLSCNVSFRYQPCPNVNYGWPRSDSADWRTTKEKWHMKEMPMLGQIPSLLPQPLEDEAKELGASGFVPKPFNLRQ